MPSRPRHTALLLLLATVAGAHGAAADQCLTFGEREAGIVREHLREGMTAVVYCAPCDQREPTPLRVRELAIESAPAAVDFIYFDGRKVTRAELEAGGVRGIPEHERAFYLEVLEEAGSRPGHSLRINQSPVDLAYLYVPDDLPRYRNLGVLAGCAADVAATLEYTLPQKPARLESPPADLHVDLTDRCLAGCCPADLWTATGDVPLLAADDPGAGVVGRVAKGEQVVPLEVRARVEPARVEVVWDHGPYFEGDVLYLLAELGEGFGEVWHYGRVLEEDVSGLSLYALEPGAARCDPAGPSCWGVAERHPRAEWWAKVRAVGRENGWVPAPRRAFEGVLRCD